MTVRKIVTPERYIGLAGDTKPTAVRSGATYYAYDSNDLYITYDNGANWSLKEVGTGALSNSGVKSADTQIKSGAGAAYWITVSDTAALAITLEDAVGTGTAKWGIDLPAAGYAHFIFDPPIEFGTGIYLNVSTATCKVTVGYI